MDKNHVGNLRKKVTKCQVDNVRCKYNFKCCGSIKKK